jgi:acid stress-induced BolA-like protein IbaG/YrbA
VEIAEVKRLIEAGIPESEAFVSGDGCNMEATVVSSTFSGKSLLQKQRMVMAPVKPQVESGEIHALAIKTFTPEEWAAKG